MKYLLTLLSFVCISVLADAQCNAPLPASATVIDTDGSYSIVGAQWVCGGVTATLSSPFVNAFIEGDANVTATTNLGVYSVRANSTLTISGANNNIYHDPGAIIIDNGTNTIFTSCPDLTFDYANAPADGCDPTLGVGTHMTTTLAVFPNPAVDAIVLMGDLPTILSYAVRDARGTLVSIGPVERGRIDISTWPVGSYLLEVYGAAGSLTGVLRVAKVSAY